MERDGWPEKFTLFDPIARVKKAARFLLGTEPVPMHMSGHYVREHFHPVEASPEPPVLQPELPMQRDWPVIERPDAGQLQYSFRDRE